MLDSKIRASSSQTERARTNTEPSCTRAELCYGNEIKDRCLNQGIEPTGKIHWESLAKDRTPSIVLA
jgi:hypothetical protein